MGIITTTWAYVDNQKKIKAEQLRIEEQKRKEEEEKKKYTVGTSHEGKKYSYDAKKIVEKLSKYDYSNNGEKIVFLTFDDGTSTTNTPKVLDILKEEDVKATFFLTGQNIEYGGEASRELIKREFEEGHAIANHTYSHDCKKLYPNRSLDLEAFKADLDKNGYISAREYVRLRISEYEEIIKEAQNSRRGYVYSLEKLTSPFDAYFVGLLLTDGYVLSDRDGLGLDMTDEDVIVEFGNNKNCRIPMRKAAIAEVEKADAGIAE